MAKIKEKEYENMTPPERVKWMKESGCPACEIKLDEKWVGGWHPAGQEFKKWLQCGICSWGFPLDWREH